MPPGAARLEVVSGNAAGSWIVVEDELIIGRNAPGAGQLSNDEEISRLHARFTLDSGGYLAIEDLGSTNGTFLNGLRITAPETLSEGDGIELGRTTLFVRELPVRETTEARPTEDKQATPTGTHAEPFPATMPATARAPEPAPAAEPTPAQTPEPLPALALRVELDPATREARIIFDDGAEPVRLTHSEGAWRVVAPSE